MRTYYVIYEDGTNSIAIPCGTYADACEILATNIKNFHHRGATVIRHNSNYADLVANGVAIKLTIYNF